MARDGHVLCTYRTSFPPRFIFLLAKVFPQFFFPSMFLFLLSFHFPLLSPLTPLLSAHAATLSHRSALSPITSESQSLITNPNFFFEFLCFFVFSHFLVDFHCISLIFLSHFSQKTQKSKVSSHLDSNTADSTSLIASSTLSYEMFIVDCWFWNWKILCTYWLLIVRLNLCSILK